MSQALAVLDQAPWTYWATSRPLATDLARSGSRLPVSMSLAIAGAGSNQMAQIRTTSQVGKIVHYVAYGIPDGEYPKARRAAVITEMPLSRSACECLTGQARSSTARFPPRRPQA